MIPISILLVDANRLFNDVLTRYIVDVHDNMVDVIGSAGDGEEAYFLAHHLRPNLILHDLGLPKLSGVPSMRALRQTLPQVGIIALTVLDNLRYRNVAIGAGADAVVYKGELAANLDAAIQQVYEKHMPCASHRSTVRSAAYQLIH